MATTRRSTRRRFAVVRGDGRATVAARTVETLVDGLTPAVAAAYRKFGDALRREQEAYEESCARAEAVIVHQRGLNLALVAERHRQHEQRVRVVADAVRLAATVKTNGHRRKR